MALNIRYQQLDYLSSQGTKLTMLNIVVDLVILHHKGNYTIDFEDQQHNGSHCIDIGNTDDKITDANKLQCGSNLENMSDVNAVSFDVLLSESIIFEEQRVQCPYWLSILNSFVIGILFSCLRESLFSYIYRKETGIYIQIYILAHHTHMP